MARGSANMAVGSANFAPGSVNMAPGIANMVKSIAYMVAGIANLVKGIANMAPGNANMMQASPTYFILLLLYNKRSASLLLLLVSFCQPIAGQLASSYWLEKYHFAPTPKLSEYINGTDYKIIATHKTPDWRVEEKLFVVHSENFIEQERPYRISPHYKQTSRWPKWDQANRLGCYCTTVYRKYVTLAGCAVITTRHILTTATPTDLILRTYGKEPIIERILGFWYDVDSNTFNSSLYGAPARIHYHPEYKYDYEVNVSHPIPCMYDLSLWAATHAFYGWQLSLSRAVICQRGVSGWYEYASSIPRATDLAIVVGFQFMKAYNRRPLPWYKYAVKTRKYVWPCPKTEWHWFHCLAGDLWGKFGFDSGGAMHLTIRNVDYRNDGFVGMCSFSMKLRSKQIVHYFTVIDTYPVLDFIWAAIKGLYPCVYLDERFEDSKWYTAPRVYWGKHVPVNYHFGYEYYAKPLIWW